MNDIDGIGLATRLAMSSHDALSPLTADEMLTLAHEMEEALILNECQFSHPDWRYVDGLRASAHQLQSAVPAPSANHSEDETR